MKEHKTTKIRSVTGPKKYTVKWSDDDISNLIYKGDLKPDQRIKVNIVNPPIKSLYLRWTPKTNKKRLCLNYTFNKQSGRKYFGDFVPGFEINLNCFF